MAHVFNGRESEELTHAFGGRGSDARQRAARLQKECIQAHAFKSPYRNVRDFARAMGLDAALAAARPPPGRERKQNVNACYGGNFAVR